MSLTYGLIDRGCAACWRQPIRGLCWLTGMSSTHLACRCARAIPLLGYSPIPGLCLFQRSLGPLFYVLTVSWLALHLLSLTEALTKLGAALDRGLLFGIMFNRVLFQFVGLSTAFGGSNRLVVPAMVTYVLGSYAATEDIGGGPSLRVRVRRVLAGLLPVRPRATA